VAIGAAEKAQASRAAAAAWRSGEISDIGAMAPPDRPARPAKPDLRAPREMPRRRAGKTRAARIALLHALAHIELNAIDLAWDLVARFASDGLPQAFYDDWVAVGDDEARHFLALQDRLADFDAAYGDLPAHDGLWQAAVATAHDPLARLAVVPLVLEARGLDVTPPMIARMEAAGDPQTAALLTMIYNDEITHVAAGHTWFAHLCKERGLDPEPTWQSLVRSHFRGTLKPPFNREARAQAGLPPGYYEALATAPV
jgi:uncharacterized ferritin-like protein (DUF455 family)